MIKSLGKNDIEKKTKKTKHWHYNCENKESDLQPAKQNLLMKHLECLTNVLHAETIERKALDLLNYPTAPVISPTTGYCIRRRVKKPTTLLFSSDLW